ncbi:MAG: ferrous iron transport protein B [Ignisphaera sp.]|nr:ferrous iron transport protein B [Ignisphaera sp.]MDW8085620.1 ferrous iron transport protein B [Ignisphaera sp.]
MSLRELGCSVVVGVIGQPNVGKTTLFNVLTGSMERVGNFPGTTVEMKVGRRAFGGGVVCFVDLPGIYGLKAVSVDERIARDFILYGDWDVLLVLVDSTLPVETSYLLLQILQLTRRVVVALTKYDEAERLGVEVDADLLRRSLGVPFVRVSALKGAGLSELLAELVRVGGSSGGEPLRIGFGAAESAIERLARVVGGSRARGLAYLILSGDVELGERVGVSRGAAESLKKEILMVSGRDSEELLASTLYNFAREVVQPAVRLLRGAGGERSILLEVFSRPIAGALLSILVLFTAVFTAFTVNTGFPFTALLRVLGFVEAAEVVERYTVSGLVEALFDWVGDSVAEFLGGGFVAEFIAGGVIEGVAIVAQFAPLVFVALAVVSAIEDSGLGPLMAVSLHGLFRRFGLSGRAVYPVLISLGCNVPGVVASRAAVDGVERLSIVASASFIPCQARLIVLLALVGAIIPGDPVLQSLAVLLVYAGGFILYLVTALLFRRFAAGVRGASELVLELPRPHWPSLRVVFWSSWSAARHFIVRAGTILVAFVVIVWILSHTGFSGYTGDPSSSFAFYIGSSIGFVLKPLFDLSCESSWVVGFAVLIGFIAKENIISTIAVVRGVGDVLGGLGLNPVQGASLLIFFMYYIPCAATATTIWMEVRSVKFTLALIGYTAVVSLTLSLIFYRTALLLGV